MATLRDLGLSEYEERAYRSLLESGPTTAKELSRRSGVPMGRIYDVLNSIEAYNLVRSQTASRPKKYAAVEPSTALERLLEDKREQLRAKAEQYESIVEELQRELDAADPLGDEEFWTAALGPEESIDLLLERLDAADERIVMIAGTPAAQFDLGSVGDRVVDHLEAALDRGVTITVLMSRTLVDDLPPSVGERYSGDLSGHPRFAVRTVADLTGSFNVVDDVEVVVEVPNPLDQGEAFAMIDLKDPGFAADVVEKFEPQWESADPLAF